MSLGFFFPSLILYFGHVIYVINVSAVNLCFCEIVKALNSIFQQWDTQAAALWNISGEPCSGAAVNGTDFEDAMNNPAITCDCSYGGGTICHITQLYASNSLS